MVRLTYFSIAPYSHDTFLYLTHFCAVRMPCEESSEVNECKAWDCLQEKLLTRMSLQKGEFRGIWLIVQVFLISLHNRKVTRKAKGMDQRPSHLRFLMKSATWKLGAQSMEPDDGTTQRTFLSGAPHSGRARWWIPAPDGNQGCNSPGSLFLDHWLPWQQHYR